MCGGGVTECVRVGRYWNGSVGVHGKGGDVMMWQCVMKMGTCMGKVVGRGVREESQVVVRGVYGDSKAVGRKVIVPK